MSLHRARTSSLMASASMTSQGSWSQFGVAVTLTTVLPLLTLSYLSFCGAITLNLAEGSTWAIGLALTAMVGLGNCLLFKYPKTMINLRRYMECIAKGEIPDAINLPEEESDILAIKEYFNLIIGQMKQRIRTIQEQQAALIDVERQRVMIQSFCTACHHLGQPATTIACYLKFLKKESLSTAGNEHLTHCIEQADKMGTILRGLQETTRYRTEPYCPISEGAANTSQQIVLVDDDSGVQALETRESIRSRVQNAIEAAALVA